MITLLISLILIIVGSIIFAYHFFSITYVDSLPNDAKTKEIKETIDMNSELTIYDNYYSDIEYVIDDCLTEKIEVTVTYYDYLIDRNIEVELHDNNLAIYEDSPKEISFNKVLEGISDDFKDNKVYNYDKLNNYKVTIKSSSNNINIIKNNS